MGQNLPDVNLDPPDDYGEVTCRTCEGEGKDVDENDGVPYSIKCGTCNGSGSVDAGEYEDDGDTDYAEDYRDEDDADE